MSVSFVALTTPDGSGIELKVSGGTGGTPIVTVAPTPAPTYVRMPLGGPPDAPVTMSGTWIWELGRPFLFYFFPTPVFSATDVITVTTYSGWCTVGNPTVVPLPAATVTASNRFGGTLLDPFSAVPKTMPVGFNIQPEDYFCESMIFSDMSARLSYVGSIDIAGGGVLSFDSNGYPLTANVSSVNAILCEPSTPVGATVSGVNQEGIDNKGPLNTPNGLYTFYWDGPFAGLSINPDSNTGMTEVTGLQVNTGTTGNRRVFNFQANTSVQYSPKIFVMVVASGPAVSGVYPFSTTNIHVYPPDPTDPTGMTAWLPGGGTVRGTYPKFHPQGLMPKIAGAKSLRFVESMSGLQNTWTSSSQIKTDTQLGRTGGPFTYVAGGAMIDIRAYTGAPVSSPLNIQIVIETNGPHGFFVGLPISFKGGTDIAIFNDSESQTLAFTGPNNPVTSIVDSTHFTMSAIRATNSTASMTNVIGNGSYCGLVYADVGTSFALSDVTDMCNQNGSDCYFNFPASVADEAVTYVATYLGNHLVGKLYVEYANEAWNSQAAPSYGVLSTFQFQHYGGGVEFVDDYHKYYLFRMGQVHALCLAAYTSIARPTTDIFRVMGMNNADPGDTTGQLLPAYEFLGGAAPTIDCGAIAVYYSGMDVADYRLDIPGLTTLTTAIVNTLSVDQMMDLLESNADTQDISSASVAALASAFPGVTPISYEGGPEMLVPGLGNVGVFGAGDFTDVYAKQHALHRHPRMRWVELRRLQSFQDSGLDIHHDLYVFGGSGLAAYSVYEWYNQPDGTGDPAENPVPEAMDSIVSQVGGAIHHWQSLVTTTPTLTISPTSGTVVDGVTTLAMTATLTGSSDSLTVALSGGTGTLSTSAPTSGVPFTYTPPTSTTGSVAVTVTCSTLGLTAVCEISYAPPVPTLTLSPTTATAIDGVTTVSLVATLAGISETIAAVISGGGLGTLSTSIPTSGVPFTYTPPASGSGTSTVSVGDGKALSANCVITYAPPVVPTTLTVTGQGTITVGMTSANFTATLDHAAGVGGVTFIPGSFGFTLSAIVPDPVVIPHNQTTANFVVVSSSAGVGSIGGSAFLQGETVGAAAGAAGDAGVGAARDATTAAAAGTSAAPGVGATAGVRAAVGTAAGTATVSGVGPGSLPLLHAADLAYVGAFRVPNYYNGTDQMSYAGGALAYNPANNSLFITGRISAIAEISIPSSIVNSSNIDSLATCTVLQPWTNVLAAIPDPLLSVNSIGGMAVANSGLVCTEYYYYTDAAEQVTAYFLLSSLDLSTAAVTGMFGIGNNPGVRFLAGYIAAIPPAWQSALGAPFLSGLGDVPIIATTSAGAAAFGFDPGTVASGTSNAVPYLYYLDGATSLGPYIGSVNPLQSGTVQIGGVAFPAGAGSVLYFGRTGTNYNDYGDPDYLGDSSAGRGPKVLNGTYTAQVWAYRASDFAAAAAAGGSAPQHVIPYSAWEFTLPITTYQVTLGGVAYDPGTGRIYVALYSADSEAAFSSLPLIQVFQVNVPGPSGPAPPTIGLVAVTPSTLAVGAFPAGTSTLLTACNVFPVTPGATIASVSFWLDSNNNGTLDIGTDALLGTAVGQGNIPAGGSTNWGLTISTAGFASGNHNVFARATDSNGLNSAPVMQTFAIS